MSFSCVSDPLHSAQIHENATKTALDTRESFILMMYCFSTGLHTKVAKTPLSLLVLNAEDNSPPGDLTIFSQSYAGINLTGYHPPRLTAGPLIFSVKIPTPGTAFQRKTSAPGSKKRNKNPHPRHNLPCSNAKRSMKKEHNSIKAVSFQIFQFSIIVYLTIFFFREYQVFASLYITLKINTV